jgi:hypothetical protein
MNHIYALSRAMLVALAICAPVRLVFAHEGHDHDKPPPLTLPIAPRVIAVTPDFELVGVKSGSSRLTIFLTSYATNAPVKDASLKVESGGEIAEAKSAGDGVFEVQASWLRSEQPLDLVFYLKLPNGEDLLTGQLAPETAAKPLLSSKTEEIFWSFPDWRAYGIGAMAGGLLALLMTGRRRRSSEPKLTADATGNHGAAPNVTHVRRVGVLLLIAATAGLSIATDKGLAADSLPSIPSTMATDLAQRLPDGTLFVPKATQHLLSIRTMVASETEAAGAAELPGVVIAGPKHFARIQSLHTGRLVAPEEGLPFIGKHVKKGEVLGFLTPHIGTVERGTVESQVAEADARIESQKVRIARLKGAPLAIPPIKIEEAQGELKALQERRRQLNPTLSERHEIISPISGVVSKTGYFAGQAIEPRDVLFEVVDPSEFWVEAITYDPMFAADGEAKAILSDGAIVPLVFSGRGLALKEQASPLLFKIDGPAEGVAIGLPVKVVIKTMKATKGFVIPSSSIVRGQSGLPVVWVKTEAERFEPQPVSTEPFDGRHVVVRTGLQSEARIVTEGASMLSQVR